MSYAMKEAMRDEAAAELADSRYHAEGNPRLLYFPIVDHTEEVWQEVHAAEGHEGHFPLAVDYYTGLADMVIREAQVELSYLFNRAEKDHYGQSELIKQFRADLAEAQEKLHRKVADYYV